MDLASFKGTGCEATKINKQHLVTSVSFTLGSSVALQFYNFLYIANNSETLYLWPPLVSGYIAIASLTFLCLQIASGHRWPLPIVPNLEDRKRSDDQYFGSPKDRLSSEDTELDYWPPYHNTFPLLLQMTNARN